ncbi:MAG: DUF2029 domain-containing protein [Chloroflexi bacterium]|nr:DUF2029 domain-containing protein [Chloroflexota bacterium]
MPDHEPLADPAASADRERRDRLILFTAFVLAVLGGLLLVLALARYRGSVGWGYDLEAYLDAARRFARGENMYSLDTLSGPFRPGPYKLYLYSPPFAVTMVPFTWLSIDTTILLWYLGRVALLVVACAVLPVRRTIRCLAFVVAALAYPVHIDLNLGNVSVLVTCAGAFLWRWLDRPVGAIVLALVMTIRPVMGLVLIWSLLRRQWRFVAWTIAAGLVIIVLSLPAVGVQGYLDFATVLRNATGVTGQDNNLDLGSTIARLGWGPLPAALALYGGFLLGIVAMLASLRYDRETGLMVTIGATLLVSPLLWDHYLALSILPAAFLAQRGRRWGLLLPLLVWLPPITTPLVAIAAMLLPFLVARRRPGGAAVTTGSGADVPAMGLPAA